MGVALLLPVTFGMDPATGLIVLGGIYCGAIFGGSISAILIHTPGTPASRHRHRRLSAHPARQGGQGPVHGLLRFLLRRSSELHFAVLLPRCWRSWP